MAMGTNEAANQAVGGSVRSNERIDLIEADWQSPGVVVDRQDSKPRSVRQPGMRKWNAARLTAAAGIPHAGVMTGQPGRRQLVHQ
jgi:hypothetical protein